MAPLARSRKELVEYFQDQFVNTGGNDILEIAERHKNEPFLAQTNLPVFVMSVAVESQIQMLEKLDDMGRLLW